MSEENPWKTHANILSRQMEGLARQVKSAQAMAVAGLGFGIIATLIAILTQPGSPEHLTLKSLEVEKIQATAVTTDAVTAGAMAIQDNQAQTLILPNSFSIAENQKVRIFIASTGGRPFVAVLDKDEQERAILGCAALTDTKVGGTEHLAESNVVLFDINGKVIGKLPR